MCYRGTALADMTVNSSRAPKQRSGCREKGFLEEALCQGDWRGGSCPMNSEVGEDSRGRKRMFKVSDRRKQIQCFYGAVGSRGGQSKWKRRRGEAEGSPDGREAVSSLSTGATASAPYASGPSSVLPHRWQWLQCKEHLTRSPAELESST